MMDGALSWLTIHAGEYVATGADPSWSDMHLSGRYPCYRIYPAAYGHWTVGALEPQFWKALCEALGRDDLLDDAFAMGERRVNQVVTELTELFATKTCAEWMEALAGMDVCVGPVNNFSEAFSDEQAVHRGMVVDVEVPGAGVWRHIGDPIRLQEAPGSIDRLPPPKMGEHTEQVLSECGGHLRGGRFPQGRGKRSDASQDRRTDLARSGGRCLHQGDAGPRASRVPETSTELPPSNPDAASCLGSAALEDEELRA